MAVVSFHTFILPFIWEGQGPHQRDTESFVDIFEKNPFWVNTNIKDGEPVSSNPNITSLEDALLYYKEYQYFHPYVRSAIHGFEKNTVTNYAFIPAQLRNKGHYYIEKGGRKYDLLINGIKLKIYNTGVALFILECENHGIDADGNPQTELADINSINDYGRRINLPFIPTAPDYYSICADRLSVDIEGIGCFEDNNLEFAKSLKNMNDIDKALSMTHMCDFIKKLLGYGADVKFTSKPTEEKDYVYIYPALDDRMFVACSFFDKKTADRFNTKINGNYSFEEDEKISKALYGFAFIDPGDDCTCCDAKMRNELLREHIYTRWIDMGTLYTVANQGITMLINSYVDFLSDTFLTQTVQMCCLGLVQRATLIHFQREAALLSANIEKSGKKINKRTITRLMNLQERFVAYQSQLSFTEVTPQEQGIEVYELLRKFMFIDKENESLNDRIEKLEAAADTNLDFSFNKIALLFTIIAFFCTVCQNIMCFFDGDVFFGFNTPALISIISLTSIAVLITYISIKIIYRRRK